MRTAFYLLLVSALVSVANAKTDQQKYFKKYMQTFATDPNKAMNSLPAKFNKYGKQINSKKNVDFYTKWNFRNQIRRKLLSPLSNITPSNYVQKFFPFGFALVEGIDGINSLPKKFKIAEQPWSGDYWPTYRGGIGARYADPNFTGGYDFKDYYAAYKNFLPLKINDNQIIDKLSPAEKYDILVGDEAFSLTEWSFESAMDTYKANGNNIESWFGLCHGWAPASYMIPRAEKTVDIKINNFQGRDFTLRFYPDDIKALASSLWANVQLGSYFIGGRCNNPNPEMDENGRIVSETCNDINPGSWHTAITNQLNLNKQNFVMDASFDSQVWNQPVIGYSYNYFQPETKEQTDDYGKALIELSEYKSDIFTKYRSNKAKYVVGIEMSVQYSLERNAEPQDNDTPNADNTTWVTYIYDLEIDAQGKIIGGEWYQNAHPDFIWTPDKNARAKSISDKYLKGDWIGNIAAPEEWRSQAPNASRYGQPFAKVVEGLIQRSKK